MRFIIVLLLIVSTNLFATVINIPDDFETIQAGIDEAEDGDSVLVQHGEYVENINFDGKAIVVIGNPDDPSEVVIDGNENGSVVIFDSGEDENSVLTGFTLTNGLANSGGGILTNNSSPVVDHCIIHDNHANNGGGICSGGGSPILSNLQVMDNTASNGGGIYIGNQSDLHCSDTRFSRNDQKAIYLYHATLSLQNVIIDNNTDQRFGGAWLCYPVSCAFNNVTIVNNTSENDGYGYQLAIVTEESWPFEGLVEISNSIIWGYQREDRNEDILISVGNPRNRLSLSINHSDLRSNEEIVRVGPLCELNWLDGNVAEDPLFINPDEGDYHLTENSPCIDAGDPDSPEDPDGTRADMGAFYHHQPTVSLSQGWNLISINITPGPEYYDQEDNRGPDVPLMIEQLRIDEDNHHVLLMKNEQGQFYVPSANFNNIPFWDLTRGYMINVDEDCAVSWTGEPIPADADIRLNQNWNIMAYFPTYELEMGAPEFYGISPIVDHVIIMKDARGRFALPSHNFSNMPPLRPTQGYQIKVDEDVLLNYPPEQEGERIASRRDQPDRHYTLNPQHYENMSLLVSVDAADGSQVAAISSDGKLVGEGVVESGRAGVAVWGDDPDSEPVEGLKQGESFRLMLWDGERESDLSVSGFIKGDALTYQTDEFIAVETIVNKFVPESFYLADPYPNPFNSTTRITYQLPTESHLDIALYDISGRQVMTLFSGVRQAGEWSTTLDGSNLSSGVYFVKLNAGEVQMSQKVVLMK